MSNDVVVRRATPLDVDAIVEVHARSWPATYRGLLPPELIAEVVAQRMDRADWIRELITDPGADGRVWVATLGAQVIGMAIWGPGQDDDAGAGVAELGALYLDPDFLGRGIGLRVIEQVQADMAAAGFTEATLWVLERNDRARRFYERCGWAADSGRKVDERPAGTLFEMRYRRQLGPPPTIA